MQKKQGYNKYFEQDVLTASPEKLVYMLYDKAIVSLRDAIKAIEEGNIERRFQANKKATEIVHHMWQTLDMENGGEIAVNLDQLFNYILNRLPEVDFNNDIQAATDVIQLLEPLHASWKELAMKNPAQEDKPTQPQASQQQQSAYQQPQSDKPSSSDQTTSAKDITKSGLSFSI